MTNIEAQFHLLKAMLHAGEALTLEEAETLAWNSAELTPQQTYAALRELEAQELIEIGPATRFRYRVVR